jgi:membrane associated rhomboid family serine protease
MKVIKIFFGILAGLFALMHCIYLPLSIISGAYISVVLAHLGGLCVGAVISITLFKSALKKEDDEGLM